MTLWLRFVERLTRACTLFVLDGVDLWWGIGDLPDDRPAVPGEVDREYFAMLESEGRR